VDRFNYIYFIIKYKK